MDAHIRAQITALRSQALEVLATNQARAADQSLSLADRQVATFNAEEAQAVLAGSDENGTHLRCTKRSDDVQSAVIKILKSDPPQIVVSASGRTSSTGWTNPKLGAWYYFDVPKDGIQDFDFTADEPAGISLPVLAPVSADAAITRDPANYWGKGKPLQGVRIHARTNTIEQDLEERSELFDPLGEGLPLPWPFPWRSLQKLSGPGTGGLAVSDNPVGSLLRVYNSGDGLTKDYRPDRYNVENV
ncbi:MULTISPECIES: hypothetical protein [Bradyrhizobium]|uniref:hypothetical protein n=1 Tax=Bradyrhizobium TaxID=374 RepID=UPI001FDA75AC|nr:MULTISPECIES: hypothetical protein [Bradyrhizobium]WLB90285.1 hypothetical protein QIH91_06950 [Bradyrhizobium japonicum USDA 135]